MNPKEHLPARFGDTVQVIADLAHRVLCPDGRSTRIMSKIVYRYGSRYYINMTNRCPCKCTFCVRNETPGLGDADSLWLNREPTADEVKDALLVLDL